MSNPIFVADELVTASKMNDLPKGVLGYTQSTTLNQASITTIVDLTGMSVTVTLAAGRRVRITGKVYAASSVGTDFLVLSIREGSTQLGSCRRVTSTPINATLEAQVVVAPTAGAHTYKLSLARGAGTGNLTAAGVADDPAFILVEDLGSV